MRSFAYFSSVLIILLFVLALPQAASLSQDFKWCAGELQWNADDTLLAVFCFDGRLGIFDLQIPPLAQSTINNDLPLTAFAWHPRLADIFAYATSAENDVVIWDMTTNTTVNHIANDRHVVSLAWNPDGRRLAVGSGESWNLSARSTINVWDTTSTPELTYTSPESSDDISRLDWNEDSSLIVATVQDDDESRVEIYDLNDNTTQMIAGDTFEAEGDAGEDLLITTAIEFVGWDYNQGWLVTRSLDKVQIWDSADYHFVVEYSAPSSINTASINPTNSLIALGTRGNIVVLDIETGEQVQVFDVGSSAEIYSLAWSHDGTKLAYNTAMGNIVIMENPN